MATKRSRTSKQSNEVAAEAAKGTEDFHKTDKGRNGHPARAKSERHRRDAESLGVSPRASASVRKLVSETGVSPMQYYIELLADENEDRETRMGAANKLFPYLHEKVDNGEGGTGGAGPIGSPTLNLNINRGQHNERD